MIERWFSKMGVAFQEYTYKGDIIFAVHIRADRLPKGLDGWVSAIAYVRIIPKRKAPPHERARWNKNYPYFLDSTLLVNGMIPCDSKERAKKGFQNLRATIKRNLGFPEEAEP